MKASMKIYALGTDDKVITTTLGYINQTATNEQIALAAQTLNALTDNTYAKVEKIEVTEIDVAINVEEAEDNG